MTFKAYRPAHVGGSSALPLPKHGFKQKGSVSILLDVYLQELKLEEARAADDRGEDGVPPSEAQEEDARRSKASFDGVGHHGMSHHDTSHHGLSPSDAGALLAEKLAHHGLQRCFEGSITDVKDDHIMISSRYDTALASIQECPVRTAEWHK